jgi:hypothetical protein
MCMDRHDVAEAGLEAGLCLRYFGEVFEYEAGQYYFREACLRCMLEICHWKHADNILLTNIISLPKMHISLFHLPDTEFHTKKFVLFVSFESNFATDKFFCPYNVIFVLDFRVSGKTLPAKTSLSLSMRSYLAS